MSYKEYTVRVYKDGSRHWWLNGKFHREDGPAIEWANGTRQWWINGKLHRTDGPAIEGANGIREWWINGKLHRTDGPAIEWANGTRQWWINGNNMTESEFNKQKKSCSGKIVEIDGVKYKLQQI